MKFAMKFARSEGGWVWTFPTREKGGTTTDDVLRYGIPSRHTHELYRKDGSSFLVRTDSPEASTLDVEAEMKRQFNNSGFLKESGANSSREYWEWVANLYYAEAAKSPTLEYWQFLKVFDRQRYC